MKKTGCPPSSLELKDECLTPGQIKGMFIKEAKRTWSNGETIVPQVSVDVSLEDCKKYLALVRDADTRPRAIGDTLIRTPRETTLRVCHNLQGIGKKGFRQLLRHETLHMGYPKHDKDFRRIAHRKGIPVSLNDLRGGKVELRGKRKEDRFYSHIGYFNSFEEAEDHARRNKKGFPYKWEIRH